LPDLPDLPDLPVSGILQNLAESLRTTPNALLHAPPGAGKTTLVPLSLMHAPWLNGRRILMLEPRRIAARAAARYMARLLGEQPGHTVGYRIRHETRVCAATRIEVVTEGVLTRLLQSDPELAGYGMVIFDEFHERSLHADLGLALCLEAQSALREDLRLLVMSATLDCRPVAALMGGCPVISCEGRAFPVTVRHLPPPRRGTVPADGAHAQADRRHVAAAVRHALGSEQGSILVFLPGTGEIRSVAELLGAPPEHGSRAATGPAYPGGQPCQSGPAVLPAGPTGNAIGNSIGNSAAPSLPPDVHIFPLYGDLSARDQDAAIAPPPQGIRKVVLATSIAETSLTIEGVRVVIDAGYARLPRFDPNSGMTRLVTERVSLAAAAQRTGRAGRLEPGVCYRLWEQAEEHSMRPFAAPEITEADLAPLALELAAWGVAGYAGAVALPWLTPPPQGNFAQACELLHSLGALDSAYRITPHGKAMLALPLHPRLAHMVLRTAAPDNEHGTEAAPDKPSGRSAQSSLASTACVVAALLSERERASGADLRPAVARYARDVPRLTKQGHAPAGSHATGSRMADAIRHIARTVSQLAPSPEQVKQAKQVDRAEQPRQTGQNERAQQTPLAKLAMLAAEPEDTGICLALAYPDRIGQQRGAGVFRLSGGRTAFLPQEDPLAREPFLAVAELDGNAARARIWSAAPIAKQDVERLFAHALADDDFVLWDSRTESVTARRQTRLGALVLADAPSDTAREEDIMQALTDGIRSIGLHCLPWTEETLSLRARVQFLRTLQPQCSSPDMPQGPCPDMPQCPWPDLSDDALLRTLSAWLGPFLGGITRRSQFRSIDLAAALAALLGWQAMQRLDKEAPTHITVPSGSRIRLDYTTGGGQQEGPVLPVKLQEMFGAQQTPTIADGRYALPVHLLSPAGRPLQVTRDLASFWKNGYPAVRAEMRGRYPKHPWPEDPATAQPTRHVTKRMHQPG